MNTSSEKREATKKENWGEQQEEFAAIAIATRPNIFIGHIYMAIGS